MEKPPAQIGLENVTNEVTRLIWKEMGRNNVTGLSIALVEDQKILWEHGFGYADKAKRIPASPTTLYRAGSISKLFTATAMMQLAEEGKADIDKPLSEYIPGFSVLTRHPGGVITLRNIMTHHSGLEGDYIKGMWNNNPEPFENLVEQLRDEYAPFPPGYVFSYSNLGFTLLGVAEEKISGTPFPELIAKKILGPARMTVSSFTAVPPPSLARGYRDGKEEEEPGLRDVPAGGLNTSVEDLSRFMMMVFAGGRAGEKRILKPESLETMLRPQNEGVPLDFSFRVGLGWMLGGLGDIDIKNAGKVIHHSGATVLFHSQMTLLPEHKLGVVVLSNSSSSRPVVDKVATSAIKMLLEARTGIKQPEPFKPSVVAGVVPQDVAAKWEGSYATAAGMARVRNEDGKLKVEMLNRNFRLVRRDDGLLSLRYRLFGFIPIGLGRLGDIGLSLKNVENREVLTADLGGKEILVGEKIIPVKAPVGCSDWSGEYELVNRGDDAKLIGDTVKVGTRDGILFMEYRLPLFSKEILRVPFARISCGEGVVYGLGRGMGETIRANVDGTMRYSGYIFRKRNGEAKPQTQSLSLARYSGF